MPTQRENRELADLMKTYFYERNEPNVAWFHTVPMYKMLLGLRGFWPMTGVSGTPTIIDQSGLGLHLTFNGGANSLLSLENLAPRIYIDSGSSQYLSRADHADVEISGTETYLATAYRGLTIGLWCQFEETGNAEGLISKWTSSSQYAYRLYKTAGDDINFEISSTGANSYIVGTSSAVDTALWYFVVGRFDPSTELALFIGDDSVLTKYTNTTSIPASVYAAGTSPLEFGRTLGSNYMVGYQSLAFLCAAYLPDYLITQLYLHSKSLFGHII